MIAVKDAVHAAIEEQRDRIVELSHDIHEHPEIAFTEEYACEHISEFLANEGFAVRKGVYGLPTAFVATIGSGPLHIGFCAEYDALPPAALFDRSKPPELIEVWLTKEHKDGPLCHACGHSLIAGAAVSAAVGLRDVVDEVGLTVSVFGTPGEELYGIPDPREGHLAPGKVVLLEAGAFEGIHAALMAHPFPTVWSIFIPTHIYLRLRARFSPASPTPTGKCEGGGPCGGSLGVPELKRLEEALKQAIESFHQIPALFVARPEEEDSGAQADILWLVSSQAEAEPARDAVRRCFEGVASSAGATVEVTEYARSVEMLQDPELSAAYRRNSEMLGRVRGRDAHIKQEIREIFSSPKLPLAVRLIARLFPRLVSPLGLFMNKFPVEIVYGTDLANVSHVIPAIHPFIGIGGIASCHEAQYAVQADTGEAYRAMLDGAVALAWTALDAATDPALRARLLPQSRGASN